LRSICIQEVEVRYPEALRGTAFGGAAAISAEGDAEGKVSEGAGPEQMNKTLRIGFEARRNKKLSSKIKLGLLAIVAAMLFALPGVFGGTREASAQIVLSNGQGDVCGMWVNAGNRTGGGAPYIPVGVHFDALARIQDAFHLPLVLRAAGFASNTGSGPSGLPFQPWGPAAAGNYLVIPFLDPLDEPYVVPFYLSASIDGQTGEAKIIDRIEDHSISSLVGRFPFVERNGVAWTWPSILNVIDMFGVATENQISPVNTVNALDVLTEMAGGGGDMDGGPNNAVSGRDIQEFFVNASWSSIDLQVTAAALTNCGLPILSGSSTITAANMGQMWVDLIYCFTIFDIGACNNLAIALGINCSIGATAGCWSAFRSLDINLDGWSQISIVCTKPGEVKLTFDPTTWFDSEGIFSPARNEGRSMDIECIGSANSATATVSPSTVEIRPVGTSVSVATVVVTVLDANGKRLDGEIVTFTSSNCNLGASSTGPFASSGVTTVSDTDSSSDLSFLAANNQPGNQLFAGTAEAYLQCNTSGATPGTAIVTWVVNNQISGTGFPQSPANLTGTVSVTVVGPPSAIRLEVTPATSTCGQTVTATATVTDSAGRNVSDGTQVFFTTTSSTGAQGGTEGAQGVATTVNGVASVVLSINPLDAGTHTVSARTGGNDLAGAAVAVVSTSTTINCSAVAAAAPSVTAPRTGQGPTIVPPNTGDAGLAASESSTSFGLFALAGVVVLALAGAVRFGVARR
jgi:hypothetical protein